MDQVQGSCSVFPVTEFNHSIEGKKPGTNYHTSKSLIRDRSTRTEEHTYKGSVHQGN